jgi:signal transduction histidine kinase
MHADVPLAAEELTCPPQSQSQKRSAERVLVSPPPVASLGEPAWEAFYALVYVASTILVESAHLTPGSRVAASLALAAMVPWYLFLGRPIMRLDEETWLRVVTGWRGPVYLTGIIALFAVAQHANPDAWFLAFSLSSQCFQMATPIRRAMVYVIVLNVIGGLMIVLDSDTAQNVATAIGTALFAIAFAVVYSRWMARVIDQSRERAALIAQLESAQAELAAAYHETGVHAERQRLAAEIHDTLAQGFLSIVTLIQAAQASRADTGSGVTGPGQAAEAGDAGAGPSGPELGGAAPDRTDPVGDYLDLVVATARENLAEARGLIAALAPASLDDVGLAGAVARATHATGKAAGIEATCAAEGTGRPLPTATEVVLLRVCQEALANVRKHAAATRVEVRLRYTPGVVELAVTDNGRGFAAVQKAGAASAWADATWVAGGSGGFRGFGLRSMEERLRQVGGTLSVATATGAGTTIRAEIPA